MWRAGFLFHVRIDLQRRTIFLLYYQLEQRFERLIRSFLFHVSTISTEQLCTYVHTGTQRHIEYLIRPQTLFC